MGVLCGVLAGDLWVGDEPAVLVREVREVRILPRWGDEEMRVEVEVEVEGRSREGVPRRGGEAAAAADILTPL